MPPINNAGFKLVAGKFIFRSKKIGGSRKLNWWLRNFRPVFVTHVKNRLSCNARWWRMLLLMQGFAWCLPMKMLF